MQDDWKTAISGKKLTNAFSSLTEFSCETDSEYGLVLRAVSAENGPAIKAEVMPKAELPREMDAVCRVDWTWIADSTIDTVSSKQDAVRFQLSPAGPLTISVQVWQGKPFLAFMPYRGAK